VGVLVLALAAAAADAYGNSAAFTEGDAHAVFNAPFQGGAAIGDNSPLFEGAPAQTRGRLGPGPRFEGVHLCATDWHLLNINLVVTNSDGTITTQQQAVTSLNNTTVHYTVDGAPLATEVSPVRNVVDPQVIDPAATQGWGQTTGAILAPDALGVGAHTEHVTGTDLVDPTEDFDLGVVDFFIDAAGTGACVG
jgi:hypothetical protein